MPPFDPTLVVPTQYYLTTSSLVYAYDSQYILTFYVTHDHLRYTCIIFPLLNTPVRLTELKN